MGLDAVRLAGILAGAVSLDVDASIRLARALGLPAERLMQMQVRYDFSAARNVVSLNDIDVMGPALTPSFPPVNFFSGRLGRASDPFGDGSLYFQDDAARKSTSDSYSGFHALWRGDGLRIYDPAGSVIWTGPVLQNLDGRILLPYEQTSVWQSWFESNFKADLAIGEEHAAFFARMREA